MSDIKYQVINKKKSKKRRKPSLNESETNVISEHLSKKLKSNKKNKYLSSLEYESKIKTKKECSNSTESSSQNENTETDKMIKPEIVNGQTQKDVQDITEQKAGVSNEMKYLNEEEAKIKEEDIDKFCDDLDDEANSQYENWIKLIEAQLHSKAKK